MVLSLPFGHIPTRFAEDRHRRHDINPVDLAQIRTGHAKQLRTQVESWDIPLLFLSASLFPLLFRQGGTLASVLSLLEIVIESLIALDHLPLAKLVTILFLLQDKQLIFLPVTLQTPCNLLLARLHPNITKFGELVRITFAC